LKSDGEWEKDEVGEMGDDGNEEGGDIEDKDEDEDGG